MVKIPDILRVSKVSLKHTVNSWISGIFLRTTMYPARLNRQLVLTQWSLLATQACPPSWIWPERLSLKLYFEIEPHFPAKTMYKCRLRTTVSTVKVRTRDLFFERKILIVSRDLNDNGEKLRDALRSATVEIQEFQLINLQNCHSLHFAWETSSRSWEKWY